MFSKQSMRRSGTSSWSRLRKGSYWQISHGAHTLRQTKLSWVSFIFTPAPITRSSCAEPAQCYLEKLAPGAFHNFSFPNGYLLPVLFRPHIPVKLSLIEWAVKPFAQRQPVEVIPHGLVGSIADPLRVSTSLTTNRALSQRSF